MEISLDVGVTQNAMNKYCVLFGLFLQIMRAH